LCRDSSRVWGSAYAPQFLLAVTEYIEAIALHLGYKTEHVRRQYTLADPQGLATTVLKSTPQGCIFLDGNLCTIYDARPKACHDFPHIALGTR